MPFRFTVIISEWKVIRLFIDHKNRETYFRARMRTQNE